MNTILPPRPLEKQAPAARAAKYKKGKIPKALREALWLKWSGKSFEVKCHTTWCQNQITAYDFQAGHNIPESRGGATTLDNLVPICSRCNLSMGSQYTFDEWCTLEGAATAAAATAPRRAPWLQRLFCCTGEAAVNSAIHPIPLTLVGPVVGPAPTLSAPAPSHSARPRRRPGATPPHSS